LQSHENQLSPQLQSLNVQGSIPMMQQNKMSSLQHGSFSSLSGVSMPQPVRIVAIMCSNHRASAAYLLEEDGCHYHCQRGLLGAATIVE
jgi:hypothetical protein